MTEFFVGDLVTTIFDELGSKEDAKLTGTPFGLFIVSCVEDYTSYQYITVLLSGEEFIFTDTEVTLIQRLL